MRTSEYTSDSALERAKLKVKEIKGFYTHFAIYLLFVPFFLFLNLISGGFPWAIFPILGWGIGVFGHAAEVFGWNPFFSKQWEERKIKEYLDKDTFTSH